MREYEVGDLVRYYSETTQEEYIGIISEPDIITWFDGSEKESVDNYADFPLEVISRKRDPRQLRLDF